MDAVTPGAASSAHDGACPYVDRGEACCARRFTLDRIDEAFAVCFGAHHGCEHFHRLRRQELAAVEVAEPASPPVILTIAGHVHREPARIRATGT